MRHSKAFKLAFSLFLLLSLTTSPRAETPEEHFAQAAWDGKLDIMKNSLDRKVDVNARVDFKRFKSGTALILASSRGHLKAVQFLLDRKADFTLKDTKGRSALSEAVSGNQLEITQLLLEKGADAKDTWMGMCLLCLSVRGKKELVEVLLNYGAEINAPDERGKTPLDTAVPYNNYDVIKLLIDRGAKADFNEALMRAVAAPQPSEKIVQLLINQGADVNYKDKSGTPVLVKAASRNNAKVITLLLERGAEINGTDQYYERTALFVASGFGHGDVVYVLLKNGADYTLQDKHGITALKTATTNNREEAVKLLQKAGAKE